MKNLFWKSLRLHLRALYLLNGDGETILPTAHALIEGGGLQTKRDLADVRRITFGEARKCLSGGHGKRHDEAVRGVVIMRLISTPDARMPKGKRCECVHPKAVIPNGWKNEGIKLAVYVGAVNGYAILYCNYRRAGLHAGSHMGE